MPITKTDFVRALQCEKMLWLDAHAPEHKIIPPEVQARLDAGNEFGDKAMAMFGDFVETTAYKEDGRLNFTEMLKKTQTLLEKGERVICEGAFTWYGNYCATDILRREKDGYILYEVKNTDCVREEFLTDLGFQRLLLRKCGVKILACKLVLRGDGEKEPASDKVEYLAHDGFLYKIVDCTDEARKTERLASDKIFDFGKLKRKDAPLPEISVGERCEKPYRCWYYEYCHGLCERK